MECVKENKRAEKNMRAETERRMSLRKRVGEEKWGRLMRKQEIPEESKKQRRAKGATDASSSLSSGIK